MAYLVVTLDNREIAFECKPVRKGHKKSDDFNIYYEEVFSSEGYKVGVIGRDIEHIDAESQKPFIASFEDLTYWESTGDFVELPEGSIKRITNRELSWYDAPVHIYMDLDELCIAYNLERN